MQLLIVTLELIMGIYSVSAQSRGTTVPSPPTHPTETGPPRDFNNCRINAEGALSWVLSVWDTAEAIIVGHGSLLTYITFISTCRQYTKAANAYEAHGQFVWDASSPQNPCMQRAEIESITKHPNCTNNMPDWSAYDFSVFKLRRPFEITGAHYPMISLPTAQDVLMDHVHYINTLPDTKGCFLFAFRNQEETRPVFNLEVSMQIIPFHERCVRLMCEMNPANPTQSAACERQFSDRENSTMLCVRNKTSDTISLGKSDSYWIAGAPLFCNGSNYGIASQPKLRSGYSSNREDFHYIVTFYRAFPWLIQQFVSNTAPWIKAVYIGNKGFKYEGDPTDPPEGPPVPTITTFQPFFPPGPDSFATLRRPSVIGILLCILLTTDSLKGFR